MTFLMQVLIRFNFWIKFNVTEIFREQEILLWYHDSVVFYSHLFIGFYKVLVEIVFSILTKRVMFAPSRIEGSRKYEIQRLVAACYVA